MAEVKWVKIVTDIFDNRKIKQIESLPEGDTIIVIWFKLLCLAGTINDNGNVYITQEIPYTDACFSCILYGGLCIQYHYYLRRLSGRRRFHV